MKRINIVGTSGSGKSTFAKKLAARLGYPYLEMDALFWKPDWQESSDGEFFAKLEDKLAAPAWVLDGNYNRSVPVKWKQVDTVIWIDFSLPRTLFQATKRAIIRSVTGEELWPGTGNKETFRKSFLNKNSILLWTITTYRKNRRRYQNAAVAPEYRHINFVRLTSPKAAKKYLASLN